MLYVTRHGKIKHASESWRNLIANGMSEGVGKYMYDKKI